MREVLSPGALVSDGLLQPRREGRSTQEPQGETRTLTQSTQAQTAAGGSSPLPAPIPLTCTALDTACPTGVVARMWTG